MYSLRKSARQPSEGNGEDSGGSLLSQSARSPMGADREKNDENEKDKGGSRTGRRRTLGQGQYSPALLSHEFAENDTLRPSAPFLISQCPQEHEIIRRKTDSLPEVKKMLKQRKQSLYVQDGYNQNMLHVACFEGHTETVAFLLGKYKESDLKLRDKNGWTPLHCAASQQHLDICEMLLKKGASPNAQNGSLTSPFAYAVRMRLSERVTAVLDLMIQKGADVNMENRWGETPLHAAVGRSLLETSDYLIKNGADVNATNVFGETALHKACRTGSIPLVELLIGAGADPTVTGYCGSPLTVAKAYHHPELVEYLQKAARTAFRGSRTTVKPNTGPSIENIDIEALLSFRADEGGLAAPMQLDRPEEGDAVKFQKGFYYEIGKNPLFKADDIHVDLQQDDSVSSLDYEKEGEENVLTIVGSAKTPTGQTECLVISVMAVPDSAGKYRGVIRTQSGDHKFFVPATLVKSKKDISRGLFKIIKNNLPEVTLNIITSTSAVHELRRIDERRRDEAKCCKIAVLYVKDEQTTEEEVLANTKPSQEFINFLEFLGTKIKLVGWRFYSGELDTKGNYHGENTYYTKFEETEIVFHVSTEIPLAGEDPQARKRNLFGSDLLTIVYLEGKGGFQPPCLSSEAMQVFAVVQPCEQEEVGGEGKYRLAVCSRSGVPQFGPPLPGPSIFAKDEYFRGFLLTKMLNAQKACKYCPYVVSRFKKTRQKELEFVVAEAVQAFARSTSAINLPKSPTSPGNEGSGGTLPRTTSLPSVSKTLRKAATVALDISGEKRTPTNLDNVKKKIKSQKDALYELDRFNQNMLHIACFEGEVETVAFLLSKYKDSDLKLRDKNGWTPLHCAASQQHVDICDMLLRRGASPNAQNGSLTSPFAYAVRMSMTDKVKELLDLMLEKGAEINMENKWGETPLHASATKGIIETTRYLILKGADINATNTYGETALHKACRTGSAPLVKLLVGCGANVRISGYCGAPLTVARTHKYLDIVEYLEQQLRNKDSEEQGHQVLQRRVVNGPSIDNIDIAALLSFRSDDGSAPTPIRLDRPEEKDIVKYHDEFYFEIGKNDFFKSDGKEDNNDLLDLQIERANYALDTSAVDEDSILTIVGTVKTPSQNTETMVITLLKTMEGSKYLGIIRTHSGDHKFFVPAALLTNLKVGKKGIIDKAMLKVLKANMPNVDLQIINNPKLNKELVRLEEMKKNESKRYKIGVLYAKEGQIDEQDIFGNRTGSEGFESFLTFLGEKVRLQGWPHYRGDLDVKSNSNGEFSIYTRLRECEIMFHVSTYLPYDEVDPQQIPRKKYIGNDLVTIVYLEGSGGYFQPPCVSGDFLHLFVVVQPFAGAEGEECYRMAICTRTGVPQFGPPLPCPPVFKKDSYFREFLLTKLVNGERAVLHSPFIASKMRRTRQMQLEYITKEFVN